MDLKRHLKGIHIPYTDKGVVIEVTSLDNEEFRKELEALDKEYKHNIFYLFNRWIIYPLFSFMTSHMIFNIVLLVISVGILVAYLLYIGTSMFMISVILLLLVCYYIDARKRKR